MHVSALSLHDFRSYKAVEINLEPGVTAFIGPNGEGKTNLVEAVDYLATLGSHRSATDTPLVRAGASSGVVRAVVMRDGRPATLEVEINPGASNRARVNSALLPRARELMGLLRAVLFSPDDLALVKGDPSERRRFLDTLLVSRTPRMAGVRADFDRVLRQRNTLLRSASAAHRSGRSSSQLPTLEVWDEHLVRTGAALLTARMELVALLAPYVAASYAHVSAASRRSSAEQANAAIGYRSSVPLPAETPTCEEVASALAAELVIRRSDELDRGISLVGPHRDDLVITLGDLPARGYASHGESWSLALALRLAAYDLLRAEGDDPILILDDVFAELDGDRREQLAGLVASAEQVLVTAAVAQDVPQRLAGARFDVAEGLVTRVG